MPLALALLQLFNVAAPGIAELVIMIRKKDGTIAIIPMLDEADKKFDSNIKQAIEWLQAHPKAPTV